MVIVVADLVGHSSSLFHSWAAELFGRAELAWKAKLAIGYVFSHRENIKSDQHAYPNP